MAEGDDALITGAIEDDYSDLQRQNLRQNPVDDAGPGRSTAEADPTGIRLGSLILRPSLTQRLSSETTRNGGTREHTLYSDTELKTTLTSDWSRHELNVATRGAWQHVLSGKGEGDPSANVDARLRLDVSRATALTLSAGYDFSRADAYDEGAVANARTQYGIHQFNGGVELQQGFGRLRGSVGIDATRWLYTDAVLANGNKFSLDDRERTLATLRGRLGYEISPALIPFVEVSAGRLLYDQKVDTTGYERSAHIYAGKAGVAVDMGEKLRGEVAIGYAHETFDDARLEELNALTLDSAINWSPRYGTDVKLGIATSFDPGTSAGTNGSAVYTFDAELRQQLRDRLAATLTGATAWTHYPTVSNSDSIAYRADVTLSYDLNRYLALNGGVGYEYTAREASVDSEVLRASLGVTARR